LYRTLTEAEADVILARHPGLQLPPQGVQLCDRDHCYLVFRKTTGEKQVIDLGTQRLPQLETEDSWWGTFWDSFLEALPGRTVTVLQTVAGLPARGLNYAVGPLNPLLALGLVTGGIVVLVLVLKKK